MNYQAVALRLVTFGCPRASASNVGQSYGSVLLEYILTRYIPESERVGVTGIYTVSYCFHLPRYYESNDHQFPLVLSRGHPSPLPDDTICLPGRMSGP